MYCGNCGFDMKEMAFCPRCGAKAAEGVSGYQGDSQTVSGGAATPSAVPGGGSVYGQNGYGQAPTQVNCGQNGGVQPAKPYKPSKAGNIIAIVIGSVFMLVFLLGTIGSLANKSYGSTSATSSVSGDVSRSSGVAPSSQAASQPQVYPLGETGQLNGVQVTVTDVKKSNGGTYDKPKTGKEFVIVTVTIFNNSRDTVSYNPLYFQVQNSQGQIDTYAFTTVNKDTALHSGSLASGGTVTGTIAFEEPKDDTGLILIYKPNLFSDSTLRFKLS